MFGEGEVDFSDATFGKGNFRFARANFGVGEISFKRTNFGVGSVNFDEAEFGHGNVGFLRAEFGEGDVTFLGTEFGSGDITFSRVKKIDGLFDLRVREISQCSRLNFANSVFDCAIDISGIKSPAPLDLTGSRLTHPVNLDSAGMDFRREKKYWRGIGPFEMAARQEDATAFRLLKKLAIEARDYERALDFFAKEKKAQYWHSLKGVALAFYWAYEFFSDYGRSVWRPALGLLASLAGSSALYACLASTATLRWLDALNLALSNSFPFFSFSRNARNTALENLFGSMAQIPDWLHIVMFGQNFLCFVLLFLLGLALRNLYRV